jgi:hypothetical protein
MKRKEGDWNTLDGVLSESWKMLSRGATHFNDPFHLDTEKGRHNFMAIACRIDSMDWLVLRVLGNRRARFNWDETGLNARWLIP